MILLPISLIAGALTILSPCVFPMLPVIIGSSISGKSKRRAYIIILSLTISIILFTLLLKVSTIFLSIPNRFWAILSGSIVILLSLIYLFPKTWAKISMKLGWLNSSSQALNEAGKKEGISGAILTGLALGPVFTSCSPTYAYILATVLPQNFFMGFLNLLLYSVGLTGLMLLITIGGRKVGKRFNFALKEDGVVRRVMGIIFLIVGIAIITRLDKAFESWLLDIGVFDITIIEEMLFKNQIQ